MTRKLALLTLMVLEWQPCTRRSWRKRRRNSLLKNGSKCKKLSTIQELGSSARQKCSKSPSNQLLPMLRKVRLCTALASYSIWSSRVTQLEKSRPTGLAPLMAPTKSQVRILLPTTTTLRGEARYTKLKWLKINIPMGVLSVQTWILVALPTLPTCISNKTRRFNSRQKRRRS